MTSPSNSVASSQKSNQGYIGFPEQFIFIEGVKLGNVFALHTLQHTQRRVILLGFVDGCYVGEVTMHDILIGTRKTHLIQPLQRPADPA